MQRNNMGTRSLLVLSVLSLLSASSHGLSETDALLTFKKSLTTNPNDPLASWDGKSSSCTWTGVLCDSGSVWGLQLENMELSGKIDVDALKELHPLRTLSFMNNKFGGPIPEFRKLSALKALYLSNNQFEGEIPKDAFEGMVWLKKVHLAQNKFTGDIPASLANLPKLLELRLDGNQFNGRIPKFKHKLEVFNLSDNALSGPIPVGLSTMDPKMFDGNKDLCGKPLANECAESSNPSSAETDPKKQTPIIIAAVVAAAAILIILAVIFKVNRRTKQPLLSAEAGPPSLQKKSGIQDAGDQSPQSASGRHRHSGELSTAGKRAASVGCEVAAKLSFLRNEDVGKFDLQGLLKASAEILGSGCSGASYKAAIQSGPVMVVKRSKQMNNVGREDFQEHMRRLGRLRHRNLLPLVAYYYRKEEKLLVVDFVEKGSLAVHLHDHQSLGQPSLDWPTRLQIVKGVASGLEYLFKELPSLIAPHGHLKSSNVLLNNNFEPLLNDYGLIPVINQENAQHLMVAYRSPEYLQHDRVTKKTDVWALGVLILEILTGKVPANFLQKGRGNEDDLATWVSSVFHGEWNAEVFDKEMGKTGNCEGEILDLMKIGLSCVEADVENRLDIKEAVEMIKELKEKEGDEDFYSTFASEADGKSSRGKSSETINLF